MNAGETVRTPIVFAPALAWLVLAAFGLVTGIVCFFVGLGFSELSWPLQAFKESLTFLFCIPCMLSLVAWIATSHPRLSILRTRSGHDAQYLAAAFWASAASAMIAAHLWAGRPWVLSPLPSGLSLAVGFGAAAPPSLGLLFPRLFGRTSA